MQRLRLACWLTALLALLPTMPVRAACDQAVPVVEPPLPKPRDISAEDLVQLRDIGTPNALAADSPLAVSPDGTQVAFILSRADPLDNRYCLALYVLALTKRPMPRVLDRGGEPIRAVLNIRGLMVKQGYLQINRPIWSPDGRWLAYLRRDRGVTQIWRVSIDGRVREPVTRGLTDTERFAWTRDGRALVATHGEESAAAQRAREALTGFAYDDRFVPSASSIPFSLASEARACDRIDLNDGAVHRATPAECALIQAPPVADTAARAILRADHQRQRAWTEQEDLARLQSPVLLWTTDATGKRARCVFKECIGTVDAGIEGLWWFRDGRDLLFLRREGWGRSRIGLYRWRPGGAQPERLLSTADLLMGCQMSAAGLLCARDGATRPRRLVLIDPRHGRSTDLFDPNPEFASIRLGPVQRLHWRNALGFECFGDLILPPSYKRGQRLPLIVVQYITRGFLRGGTGDEYPIQLFASRGYAVLSVQEPQSFYESLPSGAWRDFKEAEIANMKDWRDRRSIFSSLAEGIRTVQRLGVIDPGKIGLTGLSDGATTAQFALVNSRLFAAAAISSCCVDAPAMMVYGGPRLAQDRQYKGYAPATRDGEPFWRPISLALNAEAIDTPLLMQLPDEEYLGAIDSVTALQNAGKPVSLYVFPDEKHTKWQPMHRLAVYNRNLDWFDFWLMDKIDPTPVTRDQYRQWRRLRDTWRRHPPE